MPLLKVRKFQPVFVVYSPPGNYVRDYYILKSNRGDQMIVVQYRKGEPNPALGKGQGALEYWTDPRKKDRWLLIGPPRKGWL